MAGRRAPPTAFDQAVLGSLLATFRDHDLVDRAVAAFLARATASSPRYEEQLAAVGADIRRTEDALDRYFRAFESGTMAESVCAPRVQALSERLRGLHARRRELTEAIEDQHMVSPTRPELEALREAIYIGITSGPDTQRKALLQDLVVEVRVHSRTAIVPVFRLPFNAPSGPSGHLPQRVGEGHAAVREVFRVVGGPGLEPGWVSPHALKRVALFQWSS